ncbi:MAG: hypothetical protein IT371_06895 [Deltaproteobacteria bacterium]|nr:hypothetical protein [Deltaproteobacteria bacterium]
MARKTNHHYVTGVGLLLTRYEEILKAEHRQLKRPAVKPRDVIHRVLLHLKEETATREDRERVAQAARLVSARLNAFVEQQSGSASPWRFFGKTTWRVPYVSDWAKRFKLRNRALSRSLAALDEIIEEIEMVPTTPFPPEERKLLSEGWLRDLDTYLVEVHGYSLREASMVLASLAREYGLPEEAFAAPAIRLRRDMAAADE